VHSSSKEQEDKNRRLKKIDSAEKALEELIPKFNAYHLKTQKQTTKAVNKICEKVDGLIDVKITLITNNHLLDAAEVLRMYKRQSYLEKRMYTKKSILDVAPVFLKKESRIEAVLLLFLSTNWSVTNLCTMLESRV